MFVTPRLVEVCARVLFVIYSTLIDMVGLRDTRDALMVAYYSEYIDYEGFILLNDINQSKNDYPYWAYDRFDLENMDDTETWSEFRFLKTTYTG